MKAVNALNIADLRTLARKRLPRILFDWVEGGVEDERLLRRNEDQFSRYRLISRYLLDVERIDPSHVMFGRRFQWPFGIAPTGYAGVLRPGADLMLAGAAATAGVPFILSGNSTASIESVCENAQGDVWFQLYAARAAEITDDLLRRADGAGVRTLVYTIDAPYEAKRERDIRNGFDLPLKVTARLCADVLRHPRWLAGYLASGGLPVMGNWAPYARPGAKAAEVAAVMSGNYFATQTWSDFERLRDRWKGSFVVKGINDPQDAERAGRLGADALVISNHGGRQLDAAPTAFEILPHIRAAAPSSVKLFMDGGFRRGSDIVMALCLGADFVFVGRATLYGAIAGGGGAARAVEILADEVRRIMGQIGCSTIRDLDCTRIMRVDAAGDLAPVQDIDSHGRDTQLDQRNTSPPRIGARSAGAS